MVYEYEITSSTLMLEYYNETSTKVYEVDREFVVKQTMKNIIFNSCNFYGCTYDGRIQASRKILNTNIKIPVVVEDIKKIIFFPTKAAYKDGSRWIAFNNLDKIEKNGSQTKLYFCNGKNYIVDTSYEIIHRQLYNCLTLEKVLLLRQEKA